MATKITYTRQGDYLLPNLKLKSAYKLQTYCLPCRHQRAGGRYVFSVSKTDCRKGMRNRTTQGRKPTAVGWTNE